MAGIDREISGLKISEAGTQRIEELVSLRLTVLRAANLLPEDQPLPELLRSTRKFYAEALPSGSHVILLAEANGEVLGCGAVSFYAVAPTCDNPDGRRAYIMNMYTRPDMRRRGIAAHVLSELLERVRQRGVRVVTLEATDAGRPLYQSAGFRQMNHEMELTL